MDTMKHREIPIYGASLSSPIYGASRQISIYGANLAVTNVTINRSVTTDAAIGVIVLTNAESGRTMHTRSTVTPTKTRAPGAIKDNRQS